MPPGRLVRQLLTGAPLRELLATWVPDADLADALADWAELSEREDQDLACCPLCGPGGYPAAVLLDEPLPELLWRCTGPHGEHTRGELEELIYRDPARLRRFLGRSDHG